MGQQLCSLLLGVEEVLGRQESNPRPRHWGGGNWAFTLGTAPATLQRQSGEDRWAIIALGAALLGLPGDRRQDRGAL